MDHVIRLRSGASITVNAADEATAQAAVAAIEADRAAAATEAVAPVQEQLAASETDNAALRAMVVGETVRLKQLSATGDGFDAEDETAYLTGLPVDRLKMEYDRAAKSAPVQKVATSSVPADEKLVTVEDA